MNKKKDEENLIAEYERLRRRAHELDVETETVDRRLIEIEKELPDHYTFPGDPPLTAPQRNRLHRP